MIMVDVTDCRDCTPFEASAPARFRLCARRPWSPAPLHGSQEWAAVPVAVAGRRYIDLAHGHHGFECPLATAGSGCARASESTRGVICQDRPHLSLHQPHSLSWPPLFTMACHSRSVSA